jgi:hypothetical protein
MGAQTIVERLGGEAHTRLRYFCSPQHTDSALYPVISQMERAAGFVHDDTPQAKLDKLDTVLAQTSTSGQDAALFAEMLSSPHDGRYPAFELTPEQRRQRTLEALVSQMEALTRENPVLMIFEDAHWTDPTTLELLGRVVDRVRSLRVLLIVTFRPDFDPPWVGRAYVTFLAINRLGEREILAMIEGVIGNKPLPANIRQDIIERTDGIPLFVEEMTKAVLEAESQDAVEHLAAAVPSSTLAVPATLQASLMARLDRLGSAKEVAQIGAAIGREFSHTLLAAVVRKQETDINPAPQRRPRPHRLSNAIDFPGPEVLQLEQIAKEFSRTFGDLDEDAVAHVLRDEATKALHGLGDALLIRGNDLAKVLRVHARGERRGADEVTEHDRDLPTFGSVLALRLDCGFTRRRCRDRTAKLPDGGKHYPPMPQQYANVLQVLIGQMAECRDIDSVLGKALRVLGHAKFFEPVRNLLHCGAPSQRTLRCSMRRYLTNALA